MKKAIIVALAGIFLLLSSGMVSADKSKTHCKYDCKCDALSKEQEKCKCGKDDSNKCTCVKAVNEEGRLNGTHVCNRDCKCNTASDSHRKCGCRHEKKQAI